MNDLLQAWLEVKTPAWASSTHRDAVSRAALIEADPIARLPVARLSVSDVDRWVARMRTAGVGESSIRNRHQSRFARRSARPCAGSGSR